MKLNNPFVVRGYCGQEYFCDRVAESRKIVSLLENEGDVTLIAPRRYGKTGLGGALAQAVFSAEI